MADIQIKLDSVAKSFGNFTAVEPLNLSVERGEFVVLLGPSGCGKTTTLRMIAGLETPTGGRIHVAGRDVTDLRPGDRDIAFVFQMFALYPHLTAGQNIAFPLRAAGVSSADATTRVHAVANRLGITHLLNRKPRTLAGGDQQRVSLARAMVRAPQAFLMDEPLGTLDADQREHTRTQLRAIHNELAATTVFVTHDQLEAMSLADRIAIMNNGKLLQFAPPREIYDRPADLFVAHFIGSPGMNFIHCNRTGDNAVTIASTTLAAPASSNGKIVLGIRPEYVRITPAGIPATVEHTEHLGSYNMLELKLGDGVIKARVPADINASSGERVHITLDDAGIRWFDPTTQRAI